MAKFCGFYSNRDIYMRYKLFLTLIFISLCSLGCQDTHAIIDLNINAEDNAFKEMFIPFSILLLLIAIISTIMVLNFKKRNSESNKPPQRKQAEQVQDKMNLKFKWRIFKYEIVISRVCTVPNQNPKRLRKKNKKEITATKDKHKQITATKDKHKQLNIILGIIAIIMGIILGLSAVLFTDKN